MPHCIESGYGLVNGDGRVVPLDTHATMPVVGALAKLPPDRHGVRLRVRREPRDGEMHTTSVSVQE